MKQRLESLDALRGFDLFCLVALSDLLEELAEVVDKPWMDCVMRHFTHKTWDGFSAWDLVMPLFMFMSGVAIPYSLSKGTSSNSPLGCEDKGFRRVRRFIGG